MGDFYLLRNSLRDLLRVKTLVIAAILVGLPAGIALWIRLAARSRYSAEPTYNLVAAFLVFGFTIVLLSIVFGTGVVGQETEQKTIVYLLTRPVPRARILMVKFVAAVLGIVLTSWLALFLLALAAYGPAGVARSPLGRDLAITPVGVAAYAALSLLLGTLFHRPLIAGLFFAFGWESWVPNMPGNFAKLSVMAYLRALAPHPPPEMETQRLTDFLMAAAAPSIPAGFAWSVLAVVTVAALGLALVLFSTREYVPREETV